MVGGVELWYFFLVRLDKRLSCRLFWKALGFMWRHSNATTFNTTVYFIFQTPVATFNILQRIVNCLPNVFIPSIRHDVIWGDISVVHAQLTCMRELLKRKQWKYFINLTGQEFPLKTNWEIVQILREFKGGNDIKGSFKMQKWVDRFIMHTVKYQYKTIQ